MAVKSDLRTHTREIEALLKRIAVLENASGISGPSGLDDLFVRVTQLEETLSDEATMGPKKLAIKFGTRMNALDERLQVIEAGDLKVLAKEVLDQHND